MLSLFPQPYKPCIPAAVSFPIVFLPLGGPSRVPLERDTIIKREGEGRDTNIKKNKMYDNLQQATDQRSANKRSFSFTGCFLETV